MKMEKIKKLKEEVLVNNLKIFNLIYNITMRNFLFKYKKNFLNVLPNALQNTLQNTFRRLNLKYNIFHNSKLLKENDILRDNILVRSRRQIPYNQQWENKDFYRKNAK